MAQCHKSTVHVTMKAAVILKITWQDMGDRWNGSIGLCDYQGSIQCVYVCVWGGKGGLEKLAP